MMNAGAVFTVFRDVIRGEAAMALRRGFIAKDLIL